MIEHLLTLICLIGVTISDESITDLGAEDVVDKILQERTRQLMEDESFDLSSAPIYSRTTRNSSCPGVTEDVLYHM